ncbi:hypothetical protein G7K_0968-t1 [Saitoella complicata NRRL Y-17804]|uniref:Uncharacterized protein n=1 Tax=Saitoella complicata (strain BCRC 22490 / CBS 7301 / JCM 7358 / NBRC 10748 / NRRL Y-17804) TaxID=698492 RepID=A0A0E9NAK5_SAICN|nr:hypothetical protein G7K_0968-t1 [Saitoella complicata NRRL Y-17804]
MRAEHGYGFTRAMGFQLSELLSPLSSNSLRRFCLFIRARSSLLQGSLGGGQPKSQRKQTNIGAAAESRPLDKGPVTLHSAIGIAHGLIYSCGGLNVKLTYRVGMGLNPPGDADHHEREYQKRDSLDKLKKTNRLTFATSKLLARSDTNRKIRYLFPDDHCLRNLQPLLHLRRPIAQ